MAGQISKLLFGFEPNPLFRRWLDDLKAGRALFLWLQLALTIILLAVLVAATFNPGGYVTTFYTQMQLFFLFALLIAASCMSRLVGHNAFTPEADGASETQRFWGGMLPIVLEALPFALIFLTLGVYCTYAWEMVTPVGVDLMTATNPNVWGLKSYLTSGQLHLMSIFSLAGALLFTRALFMGYKSRGWVAAGSIAAMLTFMAWGWFGGGLLLSALPGMLAQYHWDNGVHNYRGALTFWMVMAALLLPGLIVLWGRALYRKESSARVGASILRALIWMTVTGAVYCWLWSMA